MDKRIRAARGEEWKAWTPQNAEYNVRLHPERLEQPLHWRAPRMVFVNSMSDLFHEQVPFEFVKQVFEVMNDERARKHTFQILTKRPERMQEFISSVAVNRLRLGDYPLSNVWLGVSVENQEYADKRIPLLLETPAAVRFLSCEPLLGPIDLKPYLKGDWYSETLPTKAKGIGFPETTEYARFRPAISWTICGGESGKDFRTMDLDWARSIRDQCVAADVPFFFKQQSGIRSEMNPTLDGVEWHQFPVREGLG